MTAPAATEVLAAIDRDLRAGVDEPALLRRAVRRLRAGLGAARVEILAAPSTDAPVRVLAASNLARPAGGELTADARDAALLARFIAATRPERVAVRTLERAGAWPARASGWGVRQVLGVSLARGPAPGAVLIACFAETRPPAGTRHHLLAVAATLIGRVPARAIDTPAADDAPDAQLAKAIVEQSLDCILTRDRDDVITSWNAGAERMLGWSAAEAIGRRTRELHLRGMDDERYRRLLERLRAGQSSCFESTWLARDGSPRFVLAAFAPLTDQAGRHVGEAVIAHDIGVLTAARSALAESEARFRDLTELSSDWYWEQDADLRFTLFSGIGGRTPDVANPMAHVGRHRWDLPIHPDDRPLIEAHRQDLLARRPFRGLEFRLVHGDEVRHHSTSGKPLFDADGRFLGYRGTGRDVTERRRAEAALAASEQRYRAVVAALAEGIVLFDAHGRVSDCNQQAERILGVERRQAVGRSADDGRWHCVRPDGSPMPSEELPAIRTLRTGEACSGELVGITRADGVQVWISVNTRPLMNAGDHAPYAVVASFADITEQRAAAQSLLKVHAELEQRVEERTAQLAGARREAEALSYSIAHDLRAPLRAISGYANILAHDAAGTLGPRARDYLARMSSNAERMGTLIDALLSLGHLSRQPIAREPVSMNDAVDDALAWLAAERSGRRIELSVGELGEVRGDPALLRLALVNLLSNAIKFTRGRDPARIEIGVREEHGSRAWFVRDNGAGFDMRYAGKLFGVFQRLHGAHEFDGSGVGLASVQRVVQRHGGRVWAEGEVDRGATFWFTLDENAQGSPG